MVLINTLYPHLPLLSLRLYIHKAKKNADMTLDGYSNDMLTSTFAGLDYHKSGPGDIQVSPATEHFRLIPEVYYIQV